MFFVGLWLLFEVGVYTPPVDDWSKLQRGWGVPTATDIALAWLVARSVFGRGHPAINFLLLRAVAFRRAQEGGGRPSVSALLVEIVEERREELVKEAGPFLG